MAKKAPMPLKSKKLPRKPPNVPKVRATKQDVGDVADKITRGPRKSKR